MNGNEVIALYETVAGITNEMLTAARNGDWEQVTALESRCAGHVALLQSGEPVAALSGETRVRKVQIITRILADDREIRIIAEPWMAKLSQLMHSTGTERKLSRTYGASHSG